MHWCLSFVMLFVGVMFAEAAFAFSYDTCLGERLKWDSNTATLRASPVTFPEFGPWRTALTTAVAQFNLNPSQFRYTLVTDTGVVLHLQRPSRALLPALDVLLVFRRPRAYG